LLLSGGDLRHRSGSNQQTQKDQLRFHSPTLSTGRTERISGGNRAVESQSRRELQQTADRRGHFAKKKAA
jgi:hypothetical protein